MAAEPLLKPADIYPGIQATRGRGPERSSPGPGRCDAGSDSRMPGAQGRRVEGTPGLAMRVLNGKTTLGPGSGQGQGDRKELVKVRAWTTVF